MTVGSAGRAGRPRAVVAASLLGWAWVLLATAVLVVFSAVRLGETFATPPVADAFGRRYVEHPLVTVLHIVPGLLFLLAAPVQFFGRVRRSFPALHRGLGRVLLAAAATSGALGIVAALVLPAFGGAGTSAATLVFGAWTLVAAVAAARAARARRVREHRRWVVRLYAVGLGVASIRAVVGVASAAGLATLEEVFPLAFWLGFGLNVAAAELWLRVAPHPAPARRAATR